MRTSTPVIAGLVGLLAGGTLLVTPAQASPVRLTVPLSGANEVPPVDSRVEGRAVLTVDADRGSICVRLEVLNIEPSAIAAMHIHAGVSGANGAVVVPFTAGLSACNDATDPALIAQILASPGSYYFNLHTAAHPGGEARGQLGTKVATTTSTTARPTTTVAVAGSAGGGGHQQAPPTAVVASPKFTG